MIWIVVAISLAGMVAIVLLVFKISSQVNQQLSSLTKELNERLKETALALQDTHKTVGERLDSATRVFGDVQKSLGRLEETHKEIREISKDISSLQDLLRAPKFRGEMGETLLGKLLEDVLPKENIKLQHRFKSGDIADAVIVIGQNLISIDAKFPLENFKKASEVNSEDERKGYYRVFMRDVKGRIDEVASKYILPDEGTFDFALMYIPAEAVYYQIAKDDELGAYAKSKKVIFVSPNTFYAYLQAILYGLKGVNIQRNIHKILAELGRVQLDFKRFEEDFEVIGAHLSNASKKYNDARTKLGQLNEKLTVATQNKQIESK
jgi:DNA recombination protein RmuC